MLGNQIETALTLVGVTQARVRFWLGECCCEERKEKLNQLSAWSKRVILGKTERAKEFLESIIS